ncbi:S-M checkpoint control protein rad4 like [Verticillium longisporum]|uniref:S-M checkpoint control protein rad4 like n=1 Tax=Verticillium longisporum TaxID=100787 RepID=A0A8I2ZVU6_VERLO|nr:S-M checkpoint control protein rad4 like [Verticillium longisporum]
MASPRSQPDENAAVDHEKPFQRVVVCCTSIPPDQRTEIEKKAQDLGGHHKYDLTPDVTHLIVGQYDTPKYRHVAKERPDIKAMDARWIDAVADLWKNAAEIDFAALETQWQLKPLETSGPEPGEHDRVKLLCCMTGFEDPDERHAIIEKINDNGGVYTGDLTKRVTHLIVCKPEGKKYRAARNWNIRTVSLAWLDQSVERGMILDEQYFDPVLPPEDQGRGAWNRNAQRPSALKRARSTAEPGSRKLRKTASMKLGSQRENLWGDILGSKTSLEPNTDAGRDATDRIEVADSMADLAARKPQAPPGIFTGCTALTAGFESWKAKVLSETIASLGGTICNTLQQLLNARGPSAFQRFLVVPQSSQPETHPQLPPDAYIDIVTEFFVERCLHNKTLCQPSDHVLGRPFARFPVDGFEDLAICTAGFTGIDLLHVEKCTTQMGAKYASRLNEATSVLVCRSVRETRPEKLRFARDSMIPVVSADWLWACVESGFNVPVKEFLCTGLGQSEALTPRVRTIQDNKRAGLQRRLSAPAPPRSSDSSTRQPSRGALVDGDAFAQEPSARGAGTTRGTEGSTHFQTARTHQKDSFGSGAVPAPLADLSSNALNRSPSPPKTAPPPAKTANTTGDGFSKSVDLPPPDENDPAPTAQPVLPETVTIQAEDEEEQEGKQEADAHDTSVTTDVVAQKRVREAETAAERAAISSHIASLVNTRSHASEEPTGPEGGDDRPPARRRRGIFGRATSNVSAASSASHESGRPGGRQQAHEDAAQPPPATQVRYDDPEAAQCKAELMRRMLGEEGQAVGKKAVRKRAL